MHCNNLRLVLGLGLVRVSSRVRVRVKVRVSVIVRVSIRTSWVVFDSDHTFTNNSTVGRWSVPSSSAGWCLLSSSCG